MELISWGVETMGVMTKKYQSLQEYLVTDCNVYCPADTHKCMNVRQVLWDTGSTGTLISAQIVSSLGLLPIGKIGVSGYNKGVDVKNLYLVHIGLPTGDVVLNVQAMECDSDDYDVVLGMDIINQGDFAFTNKDGQSVFSFRIPSKEHIELTE